MEQRTNAPRRKRARRSSDDSNKDGEEGAEQQQQQDSVATAVTEDERERLVKGVVRLALFSVDSKRPVAREDLTKRVFARLLPARATVPRTLFRAVMAEARQRLQSVFGYDLVDLRDVDQRAPALPLLANAPASVGSASQELSQPLPQQQHQQQQQEKQQGKRAAGTGAYVLVNVLPPGIAVLREPADEQQQQEEGVEAAALRGLLLVVLALVVLSGGKLAEDALVARLHSLRADAAFGVARRALPELLTRLVHKQYLARQQRARTRTLAAAAPAAEQAEYRVGPRALAEFSRVDALRFVADVVGVRLTPSIAEGVLAAQQDAASIRAAFDSSELDQDRNEQQHDDTVAAADAVEEEDDDEEQEEQTTTQRRPILVDDDDDDD